MKNDWAMEIGGPLVITGASGFVGANLCRYFLSRGLKVVGVQGNRSSSWRLDAVERECPASWPKGGGFDRRIVDLRSKGEVSDFIRATRPAVLINCAAYGAYPSQTDSDRIFQVNFDAVRTLVDALRELPGFRAFIQAGSSSEYGLNCARPAEEAFTRPDSEYAVSKLAATQLVLYNGLKRGFPGWTLRLYSVYGPFEEASRLIPRLLARAAEGGFPPLVDPEISRDFVYVEDVCQAFEKIVEKAGALPQGEIFNIGSGTRTRLRDLVGAVRAAFSIEAEPGWGSLPERGWDHADWYADPAKAARDLSWRARTSLATGLELTGRWMAEHPEWVAASREKSVARS